MHQPLIPAGGSDLHTAATIGNLQAVFDSRAQVIRRALAYFQLGVLYEFRFRGDKSAESARDDLIVEGAVNPSSPENRAHSA
jgi:hypothetical protein